MNSDTFAADMKMLPHLIETVQLLSLFAQDELAAMGHSVVGGVALVHTIQVAQELESNLKGMEQELIGEMDTVLRLE